MTASTQHTSAVRRGADRRRCRGGRPRARRARRRRRPRRRARDAARRRRLLRLGSQRASRRRRTRSSPTTSTSAPTAPAGSSTTAGSAPSALTRDGHRREPVFVGIARAPQVDAYLRGVEHDEITDFELDPFSVDSTRLAARSAAGRARQRELLGRVRARARRAVARPGPCDEGDWAVVVMNADGSTGVATDVSVGAKVRFVLWIGVGLLVAGAALAVGGGALIVAGARTPPRSAVALPGSA